MMCYPSIDSLIKKVDSKYTLVTLAAQRARELTDGQPALIPNAHIALITITKVTAAPILVAVSIFPDTPKKGQIPRKYARTKLLIRLALIKMLQSDASLMLYYFLL